MSVTRTQAPIVATADDAQSAAHCPLCTGTLGSWSRCDQCGAAAVIQGLKTEALISQHGHSRLYRCRAPDGTAVAVKELLFALVPTVQQIEAFEREASVLLRLKHPQTPRFISSFRIGEGVHTRMYLVQQFIEGKSVAQMIAEQPLPESQVLDLALQALTILKVLHSQTPRVLHRDLKPANLIVDEAGRLFMVDFGSARDLQGQMTFGSTLVGTFGYMAPEQLGGTVDQTSDLFALGATLLHALTGKQPEQKLLQGDLGTELKELKASATTMELLKRMTAPRRADRFATADEVLAFLATGPTRRKMPRALVVLLVGLALIASLKVSKSLFPQAWNRYDEVVGGAISKILITWAGLED